MEADRNFLYETFFKFQSMNEGWIKLNRDINKHWIWEDPVKLKWWIDILLTVNYSDTQISIGYKVFTCYRGESLMSLQSWAKRWKVSKSVVNRFFEMLRIENMLTIANETVTTRITVCNYDSYQQERNASETQTKRKRNANGTQPYTIKENKESKERKEDIILTNNIKSADLISLESWMKINSPRVMQMKEQMNSDQLNTLLKKYTKHEIVSMLECMHNYSPLLTKNQNVYLTLNKWLKKEHDGR